MIADLDVVVCDLDIVVSMSSSPTRHLRRQVRRRRHLPENMNFGGHLLKLAGGERGHVFIRERAVSAASMYRAARAM